MNYQLRDRVYDITRGWGTVVSLNEDDKTYPIEVEIDETGEVELYTNCGKFHICDVAPSLYWGEVKIEMIERITFTIPFEGFYQTDLSEELDNHILSLCDENKVDWEATHAHVAEQYAIKWLDCWNLQTGRFEEYLPPRTVQPRHFLNVSVDLEELHYAYADILAEYGKPTTQVEWAYLKPEIAWEDAWAYLEQEVDGAQNVPNFIREALKLAGHMDPIFKE